MKKSGLFAASMAAAASATTYSVSSSCSKSPTPLNKEELICRKDEKSEMKKSAEFTDKFAARFDGLRFIETLVTAHR